MTDQTVTERLRALLDERGVEWWAGDGECDRKTHWESNGLTWEYFNDDNGDAWLGFLGACEHDVSPEQAIYATLGSGTCHAVFEVDAMSEDERIGEFVCSECGETLGDGRYQRPRYCPNCGRAVVG